MTASTKYEWRIDGYSDKGHIGGIPNKLALIEEEGWEIFAISTNTSGGGYTSAYIIARRPKLDRP